MTTLKMRFFDEAGVRPQPTSAAATLALLAGTMTVIGCTIIGQAALEADIADWRGMLVLLVTLSQLAAGVLLLVGGARLALGTSRTELVTGAVLLLAVCAAYLLYALTEVRGDTTEGPSTWIMVAGIDLIFAVLAASSLLLAVGRGTSAYLRTGRSG